jgi:hypothetical protein
MTILLWVAGTLRRDRASAPGFGNRQYLSVVERLHALLSTCHMKFLPTGYDYPFRMRIPTKMFPMNSRFVTTIHVVNQQPRGFWMDRSCNLFSGI